MTLDPDALAAFRKDAEKVQAFLAWARGIPRNSEVWVAERRMADQFLAILDAREAEPPQRALEWEMVREIEALQVKLADREAQLAEKDATIEKLRAEQSCSLTVGGGLVVHGSIEAIGRCQQWVLLDSNHPQEREDVRRTLMRQLTHAEAKRDYAEKCAVTLSTKLGEAEATLARVRAVRDTWNANSDKYKKLHVADVVADLDRALLGEEATHE